LAMRLPTCLVALVIAILSSSSVSLYATHAFRLALLFTFSFYCCGPHRDLHSFPTRRSSDLHDLGGHRLDIVQGPLFQGLGQDGVDRKSTRLNSSHVSISYAVFCLKKKII